MNKPNKLIYLFDPADLDAGNEYDPDQYYWADLNPGIDENKVKIYHEIEPVLDDTGKLIKVGDTLELTFHEGKHNEHTAWFNVVFEKNCMMVRSQSSGNCSVLMNLAENVGMRVLKLNGEPMEVYWKSQKIHP